MNLVFIKKSGGGISSTALGVLLIAITLVVTSSFSFKQYSDVIHTFDSYLKLHYIYMEAVYYIRNEIYEETRYDLSYNDDSITVTVDFHFWNHEVDLFIRYLDAELSKTYVYDTDCLCIIGESTDIED